MGWLSAYLPAVDAAAVWGVVDDMAHQLRHVTGEERTLSQLRADSLTGIITGRLLPADRYTNPDNTDATGSNATGSDATGSDATGSDAGTDTATGTGTGTGNTEHIGSTEDTQGGAEDRSVPVCTCGGRPPVKEVVQVVRITPTRPVVRVTIPATALLGLDNAPGELAGFGPVPAETARIIAADATWQRLLTDPATGILTDYSTTTYQPGKTLRGAVEARDATCTFPGCDNPADRCDLDHIQPFAHKNTKTSDRSNDREARNRRTDHDTRNGNEPTERGQTNAHNLHTLCRKHHLLKTHADWNIVRDPHTGTTTWTTPTGRTHTRPPTVLDTHIDLDDIDPDTSHDLSLQALTGQRLPRAYATTEPGSVPNQPHHPANQTDPANQTIPTDAKSPTGSAAQAHHDEPPF
jgi:hypothetical protein